MKCPLCKKPTIPDNVPLKDLYLVGGSDFCHCKQKEYIKKINQLDIDNIEYEEQVKLFKIVFIQLREKIENLKRFEKAFDNLPEMWDVYGNPIDKEEDILKGLKEKDILEGLKMKCPHCNEIITELSCGHCWYLQDRSELNEQRIKQEKEINCLKIDIENKNELIEGKKKEISKLLDKIVYWFDENKKNTELKKEFDIVCNLLVKILKDVPKDKIEKPYNILKKLGIKIKWNIEELK